MKASDVFVKALENEGVEYIFAVPGEENLDVLESLRTSTIKHIITRHEQAAGFMAATYGRLTGKPGVALSTLGPGATNFVTAVAYAQLGGMPAVFITGQKPVKKSKQGEFQVVDIVSMMKPLTKYTKQIVHGHSVSSITREAFKVAADERPGAVHIELPEDIAREEVGSPIFYSTQNVRRPVAEEKTIQQATELIKKAKFPLLCVGSGANRKRATNMLTEFVHKTGIYFFTTQMGKGVINEESEYYLGTAALSENDFLHCAIDRADLIINVGHDSIEKPPFIMRDNQKTVIHINFNPAIINDVYFPQQEVIGDIANSVWQLKEKLSALNHDNTYFKKIKQSQKNYITKKDVMGKFPLMPLEVVETVRDVLGPSDIVALDNGVYKLWFARNYCSKAPNTLLLDNALATMGAGLPSAIAAKLVNPNCNLVAISGDGGFMMNSQELETAVRLGMSLTIIILNDNAYGMIKWKQEAMGFENFALDYGNPDFTMYAKSYGARGLKVEKAGQLEIFLRESIMHKGVTLIEVPVDYSQNIELLVTGLKSKSCEL
jgi:acetolactate synthase I/II/III large subunit